MSRNLSLAFVLVLLAAAVVLGQKQQAEAPVSASAFLFLVADTERELTRLPAAFTRLSDQEEIDAGNQIARYYLSSRGDLDPEAKTIEAYVQRVGMNVAPYAERKLPYKFHYIPDRGFFNAFALPGGHVFIGAGLLEQMDSEDQLAMVLGHEVEHIDHYHCAERLQLEAALRKVPLAELVAIPIELFQAGYSKDQELEADREGTRLAARSGYSATAAIRLFEMFDRLYRQAVNPRKSPGEEASRVAVDVLTGYFRSHPLPSERIAQIRSLIGQDPSLAGKAERELALRYVFLAWQAQDALDGGKPELATKLALRSLEVHPQHFYFPALVVLAKARFTLEDFGPAKDAYHKILALDPTAANGVLSWVQERIEQALNERKYARAVALAQNLLEVQPAHPQLLRLLALAQLGSGHLDQAVTTAQQLKKLYPDDAEKFADDLASRANQAFGSHDFQSASSFARLSLGILPSEVNAGAVLAESEFALAHFGEAAHAFRYLLTPSLSDVKVLRAYADSLASVNPSSAAREFESSTSQVRLPSIPEANVKVEVAGLRLLAGDESGAQQLLGQAEQGGIAPEFLARLGWWYLRAQKTEAGRAVLQKALGFRPGDGTIRNNLGWAELELGHWEKAQEHFLAASVPEPPLSNTPTMGQAIGLWEQHKPNDALNFFQSATSDAPQWLNPEWRRSLYPPGIAEAVGQIQAEQERRELARKAALRRAPVR